MATQATRRALAHVRFDGRSLDLPLDVIGLTPESGDDAVRRTVARHLDVSEAQLRDYVIDRHESGNLTVRPAAVFG